MPYRRKKLTFAISSPDEFLSSFAPQLRLRHHFVTLQLYHKEILGAYFTLKDVKSTTG